MNKRFNKLVSCLLVMAMVFTGMSMATSVFAASKMDLKDGVFSIEAEGVTINNHYTKVDDPAMSGAKGLNTEGDFKDKPLKDAKGDLEFSFTADKAAKYYLWARVNPTTVNKGIWLSMGGSEFAPVALKGVANSLTWVKLGEVSVAKALDDVLIKISTSTGYFKVDKFVVSSDATYVPEKTGTAVASTPKPSTSSSQGGSNVVFETKDGLAKFEAENVKINANYNPISGPDMSGGKGLNTPADGSMTPSVTDPADIEFTLKADQAGNYAIWLRVNPTSANKTLAVSINQGEYKTVSLSGPAGVYHWRLIAKVSSVKEGDLVSVRIRTRIGYFDIDNFLITNKAGVAPEGVEGKLVESVSIVKLDENAFPKPSITPPPEHPRLLFRKSDIPAIKANMAASESAAALAVYNQFLASTDDGILADKPGSYNFDGKLLSIIEAKALEYAVNGNQDYGKQALSMIKNVLKTVTFYKYTPDPERPMGQVIFTASEVYDWCFPLLTAADKTEIVAACENIAQNADGGSITGMEIGWPPKGQGAITGHGGEGQLQRDLLSFGIATYDEYPDIYNYVGGRFLQEWPKTRNYWATSHTQHQGSAYGPYRYNWDLWGQTIIQKMSGQKIYIPDAALTSYQWIYTRRPDGQLFREGDEFNESAAKGAYWNVLWTTLFFSANLFKDPYLKKELLREDTNLASFNYNNLTVTPSLVFLLNDPSIGVKPLADLPLTKYFASPVGQMVARTGWNDGISAPDALAFMKVGEVWAANHNHLDIGSFQIYYKGILASESGYYDYYYSPEDRNYNKRTIAHNSLLIYDPNEKKFNDIVNSGGQRIPGNEVSTMDEWMKNDNYKMATVIGHEFGPDPVKPAYTYLAGDITKAYSDKVKQVLRSMIFMPLQDADHPAAFIVMDKITSSKPEFKKTFLLHSQEEPQINGNVSIIKRDTDGYNGMLTNQTLLPKNAKITKVGGTDNEYSINGTNYPLNTKLSAASSAEAGWGRIEVSPAEANETDYFLNVMYVSDADKNLPVSKATLIETDKVAGAKLLDRVAVFAKDSKRLEKEVTFKVDGSETTLNVNVAGLKEGAWSVSVNGKDLGKQIASKDGGIIYFTAPAGDYKLTYADANATKPVITPAAQNDEGIDIKVGKAFLYSDVPATVINDRTLVPMRAIFEALSAKVTWDEATLTATAVKGNTEIKITQDSKTVYINSEAKELDVPAMVINGRFMVPVRFVSEAMGAKVDWDAIGQYVIITPSAGGTTGDAGGTTSNAIGPSKDGVAQIISSKASKVYQETYPNLSYDGDPVTLWSAEGTAEWISYEFKDPATILSVYILLNKATERQAYFDIQSSADGETYTTVLSCTSDKKSEGELFTLKAPVTSKYFRIFCKGNSVSAWNAIKEIEFRTK